MFISWLLIYNFVTSTKIEAIVPPSYEYKSSVAFLSSVTVDKYVTLPGEAVTMAITLLGPEGIPLSGHDLKINYISSWFQGDKKISKSTNGITNVNGQFTTSYTSNSPTHITARVWDITYPDYPILLSSPTQTYFLATKFRNR